MWASQAQNEMIIAAFGDILHQVAGSVPPDTFAAAEETADNKAARAIARALGACTDSVEDFFVQNGKRLYIAAAWLRANDLDSLDQLGYWFKRYKQLPFPTMQATAL